MSNIGRPKGKNNKEYVYSLRMDERTKTRLETYCRLLNMTKSEVIRFAIDRLREENDYGENMGCNNNENDIVNIGLHFILKNVRPYAAPCSEA